MPLRNTTSNPPPGSSPPKAFQLTKETAFDVDPGQYQWSPDSRFVLYLFDRDPRVGDRYRLWRKEVARPGEEAVDLLPQFSTTKRSSLNRSEGGALPLPPSNRTLPPGLMGDNLHIGQFFVSEKVPVSKRLRGRGGEEERERKRGREEKKTHFSEKLWPQKKTAGHRLDHCRRALSRHL